MSFSSKKRMKTDRRIRNANSVGNLLDIINLILGVLVIIFTFIIMINFKKNENMFAFAFLSAALMNICMGIKYYKRHEIIKFIALMLAGIFMIVMTVISFKAFW